MKVRLMGELQVDWIPGIVIFRARQVVGQSRAAVFLCNRYRSAALSDHYLTAAGSIFLCANGDRGEQSFQFEANPAVWKLAV